MQSSLPRVITRYFPQITSQDNTDITLAAYSTLTLAGGVTVSNGKNTYTGLGQSGHAQNSRRLNHYRKHPRQCRPA